MRTHQPSKAPGRTKRKYVVRVPVTVTLCVEVTAIDQREAIRQANDTVNELTPLYVGFHENTDKPTMLEADGGWFEDCDGCELFYANQAKVARK